MHCREPLTNIVTVSKYSLLMATQYPAQPKYPVAATLIVALLVLSCATTMLWLYAQQYHATLDQA